MTQLNESAVTEAAGAGRKPSVHKRGVKVERIYTTAGRAPLRRGHLGAPRRRPAELEDRRDGLRAARGGVPRLLGVNASTIVTTKYFRGAVGTDARESEPQAADRPRRADLRQGRQGARLLRDRRGRRDLRARADLGPAAPGVQLQLAGLVQRRHRRPAAGLRVLHPRRRRHDGLDPQLVPRGGPDLQGRLRRRPQPVPDPLLQGAAVQRRYGLRPGVSFMRGADASAGTIKSGGATRRAAKMVVLDVDHPDIEEFVETKAREEDKIRALRDAGFDMDLGGKDITSRAVPERQQLGPRHRRVHARGRGRHRVRPARPARPARSSRPSTPASCGARSRQAAWECADPGIQYDDTINDWHTNPETGRITASNPCSEYMSPGQLLAATWRA